MKNKILVSSVILFLSFAFLVHLTPIFAQNNINRNETVILAKDRVINEDYFAVGETVTLSGTVNGDAYIFGGNIVIDGTVNGDLITGGGTVNIRGKVSDDVRAGAGQITVSGQIGKNLTVGAGTVEITDSAQILGSIVAGSGNLSIFAPVGKGVNVGAGNVTVGSKINGNVNAAVGSMALTPEAQIAGNLNYISEEEANIQPGAQVNGKTSRTVPQKPPVDQTAAANAFKGFGLFFKVIGFVSILIIGLLFIKFLPNYSLKTAENLKHKFWLSLLTGVVSVILTPIAAIVLLITLIGIPFSIGIIFALIAYLYLSKIFVSIAIGQKITKLAKFKASSTSTFIIGLSVYTLISLVPIIGPLFSLTAILSGMGAVILTKREFYLKLKSKKEL